MRQDRPSSTAAVVCAARAEIDRRPTIREFSEPYAERLLPPGYSITEGARWQRRAAVALRAATRGGAHIIALRTMAIDEGVRTAPALRQLVILGAGLDARAWRMPELAGVPVFEVDHPATQAYKRARAAAFGERADHHYVSVDFERDALDECLAAAGHDPSLPTVWIWEGVTMYLAPEAVAATLTLVSAMSASQSVLLTTYLPRSMFRTLIGLGTALTAERFKASFAPAEMAALLAEHGLSATLDESAEEWHERWALPGVGLLWGFARTERLVTAVRD